MKLISTNLKETHKQVAPRIFVNDVIVRFHKTLELEEDEAKTLICRYPPPLAAPTTSGGHEFDLNTNSAQVASSGAANNNKPNR